MITIASACRPAVQTPTTNMKSRPSQSTEVEAKTTSERPNRNEAPSSSTPRRRSGSEAMTSVASSEPAPLTAANHASSPAPPSNTSAT